MLEICSGCGGLALGLPTTGFELSAHIEIDPEAAESYAVNFGGGREAPWALPRDLERCSTEKLVTELGLHTSPDDSFDILAAGLPCQAFARIGRSKLRSVSGGNDDAFRKDPRASLYRRFLRYAGDAQPLVIIIENVPDILNFGGHNVPEEICEVPEAAGYSTSYTLLNAARQRLARNAAKSRATLERRLEAIAREVKRAVDGICKGIGDPVALGARTKELAIERSEIEQALKAMPKTTEAIMLHPTVLSHYESQVAALQTAMTQELRRGDSEPARILRELIETVTVKAEPSAPTGLRIEIAGRLRALLGERAFPTGSVVCGTLVAEDGFEPPTRGL